MSDLSRIIKALETKYAPYAPPAVQRQPHDFAYECGFKQAIREVMVVLKDVSVGDTYELDEVMNNVQPPQGRISADEYARASASPGT